MGFISLYVCAQTLFGGERETTANIAVVFPFALIAKGKTQERVSTAFQKREKISRD